MEIKLNGKTLNAALDNENTLGEVLSGIEEWLTSSGHRMAELKIDGELIKASELSDAFAKDINAINCIEIQTSVIAELTAASLINLIEDINVFKKLEFQEKARYAQNWKESPTARFIASHMSDLYAFCLNTFANGELSVDTLLAITEEIQREVNEPVTEIKKIKPVIEEICIRLTDLPLDIQTGKDARAAQTIQVFSAAAEKLFRIFKQLDIQGFFNSADTEESKDQIDKRKSELVENFTGFSNIIKELYDAYEKNDTVLIGDLAEYEASVKLKELYSVILNNIKGTPL